MIRRKNIENNVHRIGQMISLDKDEVTNALKSRKNIIVAGALTLFAFIVVQNITYGTLKYMPPSINDFFQFGRFL